MPRRIPVALATTVLAVAWASASLPARAQMYRCVQPGSGIVLQQAPCAPGTWGSRVEGGAPLPPAPPVPPLPPGPAYPYPSPYPFTPPGDGRILPSGPAYRSMDEAERLRRPSASAPGSPLEVEAAQCLDWYRPLLADPRGAYYSSPSKDARVLSITIHVPGVRGGVDVRDAACEILNGRLDEGWTRIHAERRGWY